MFKLNEKNRKWWVLAAMTSSISMIFIDVTVLPVALPTIQRSLDFTELGLQWIINIYTLVLATFVIAGGKLGDRVGHRQIFLLGLLLFALGSILCGFSHHEPWFILARALQGLGGALLIPTSATILFNAFPPQGRGKAMGIYVSIGSVFLALGPFIGGLCTQYLSWRFVFWLNVPIACAGYLLTLRVVAKTKGEPRPFDKIGFITSTFGISAITIAIMQSSHWGWTSPWTLGLLVLGLAAMGTLWAFDHKINHPYIPFAFFQNRLFLGAVLTVFLTQFLLMVTVFWARFFQDVYGLTPSEAGLLSFASNLPIILTAPLGGHLSDRHGPRVPIVIGFLLVIGALFAFIQIVDLMSIPLVLATIIPFGIGMPLILTPSYTTAMGSISMEKRGSASGLSNMLRQLGATLGLAAIGSAFVFVSDTHFARDLQRNLDTVHTDPAVFEGLLAKVPDALQALEKLPSESQLFVEQASLHAYIDGFIAINAIAMGTAVVGLCFAAWLLKWKREPEIPL